MDWKSRHSGQRYVAAGSFILKAEHGVAEWKIFHKHNSSVPAHKEVIDEVKAGYDVMVAGVGD